MYLHQCYEILGLDSSANKEQIKRAYRKRAKEFHPDTNNDSDANLKFQLLNEAYHTLIKELDSPPIYDYDIVDETRKYGNSRRNKSYNRQYCPKSDVNPEDSEANKPNVAPSDKYMFYIFVLIGINMLVYGIKRLLTVKEDFGLTLAGVLTSIFFLVIIIYGWNLLRKSK